MKLTWLLVLLMLGGCSNPGDSAHGPEAIPPSETITSESSTEGRLLCVEEDETVTTWRVQGSLILIDGLYIFYDAEQKDMVGVSEPCEYQPPQKG